MRYTVANSPKVGGCRDIPCRKGQAPSLQGNGCGFAGRCGLTLVLLRNVGDDVPYVEKLRIRRTFMEISQLLRGRRDAAPYKAAAGSSLPSPSGGRWHPPIPREADDGRGRT